MRKAVFCLAGAAFAVTAVAEMKNNPDPNTLWCEDGHAGGKFPQWLEQCIEI